MTKKDYVQIAQAINNSLMVVINKSKERDKYICGDIGAIRMVTDSIIRVIQSYNPQFDSDKFLDACWIGVEK